MKKVSFIVIAKNEIFNIEKCINAILATTKCLDDYEIIFVDSGSIDGTLEKVKNIPNEKLRIFQITLNPNAARARNLGASQARFEFIFFIDGDVIIDKDFLPVALTEMNQQKNLACILGQLEEIQYSQNFESILKIIPDRFVIDGRSTNRKSLGGIFLTRQAIFLNLHGFDDRLDTNEDRDFGFRVLKKGPIYALPYKMGTHHTIYYRYDHGFIYRARHVMFIGLLIRKHILSLGNIYPIFKNEHGLFLGMCTWLILILYFVFHNIILMFFYLMVFLADVIKGFKVERNNLSGRLIHHYIYPLFIIIGFLFLYPRKIRINWIKIVR